MYNNTCIKCSKCFNVLIFTNLHLIRIAYSFFYSLLAIKMFAKWRIFISWKISWSTAKKCAEYKINSECVHYINKYKFMLLFLLLNNILIFQKIVIYGIFMIRYATSLSSTTKWIISLSRKPWLLVHEYVEMNKWTCFTCFWLGYTNKCKSINKNIEHLICSCLASFVFVVIFCICQESNDGSFSPDIFTFCKKVWAFLPFYIEIVLCGQMILNLF